MIYLILIAVFLAGYHVGVSHGGQRMADAYRAELNEMSQRVARLVSTRP